MSWKDAAARANAAFIDPVVGFPTPATFTPQLGQAQAISGVIVRPAIEEDTYPGSPAGTSIVRLWVNFETLIPPPRNGDRIELNGATYDVNDLDVDPDGGGAVLKLRRSS